MPTIECSRFHFISNLSLSIFSLEYRSLFLWFDIVFCDHYRLVSNWVLFTLDHWLLWHSFTDISPFEFGIFYCVLYRVFSISILLVRFDQYTHLPFFLPQSNRTFLGNFTYPFSKTLSFSLHYVCIWWLFFLALFIDISPFESGIFYSALYHFFLILILLVRFYQNTHLPFLLPQSNRTLIELFQNILLLPPLRLHSHINRWINSHIHPHPDTQTHCSCLNWFLRISFAHIVRRTANRTSSHIHR